MDGTGHRRHTRGRAATVRETATRELATTAASGTKLRRRARSTRWPELPEEAAGRPPAHRPARPNHSLYDDAYGEAAKVLRRALVLPLLIYVPVRLWRRLARR